MTSEIFFLSGWKQLTIKYQAFHLHTDNEKEITQCRASRIFHKFKVYHMVLYNYKRDGEIICYDIWFIFSLCFILMLVMITLLLSIFISFLSVIVNDSKYANILNISSLCFIVFLLYTQYTCESINFPMYICSQVFKQLRGTQWISLKICYIFLTFWAVPSLCLYHNSLQKGFLDYDWE